MKIQTPTYLINADVCMANIRKMAAKAARSGVSFRPHFKTHQSLAIGRWYREAGITKITVSSLTAAKYFSRDGWNDITVAFPVNLLETDLINELAATVQLGLLVEDPFVGAELQRRIVHPVDIYIKIDTGYHRTGLGPDEMPVITELARVVGESPMLRLKGLLTHAGHTYGAVSSDEVKSIYRSSTAILNSVRDKLGESGSRLVRSYGDTPSCSIMEEFPGVDEIRPGNFVFYDMMQLMAGNCLSSDIGGIVLCPVVAVHPARRQAVIYGGAIHFSKDFIEIQGRRVFGQVVELDEKGWKEPVGDAFVVSLSQEHGIVEIPEMMIKNIHPGMVLGIIPVHSCLTANLLQGYQMTNGLKADYMHGN